VRVDSPAIRHALADDEPGADDGGLPTERFADGRSESPLPIQGAEEFANINDLGLELDYEQRPSRRTPGQNVDNPPLAVDPKRHFGSHDSPGQRGDTRHHPFGKRGVSSVHDSVEVCPTRSRQDFDPHLERGSHLPDNTKRQSIEMPAFDPGDRGVGHASGCGEIGLPPASADPGSSNYGAEPKVVHCASVSRGDCQPLTFAQVFDILARGGDAGG
jgi:hypothetical protein